MDYSVATPWWPELGTEDEFLNDQYDIMDYFDENISSILEDDPRNSPSPRSNPSTLIPRSFSTSTLSALSAMEPPSHSFERPSKQHKSNSNNLPKNHGISNLDQPASRLPTILTFGNPYVPQEMNPQQVTLNVKDDDVSEVSHGSFSKLDEAAKTVQTKPKKIGGRIRPPSQTYDHIVAERKRRQELSQRFIALSAMVPGLKKMDKTSVLGDAIKYLKHLQERVKTLEEQSTKQTIESLVLVKKSQVFLEDEGSSDEMSGGGGGDHHQEEQTLPEIQVKLGNRIVLLRVHCEKHRGVLVNVLHEIEKLKLSVTHASVAPFGNLALDMTIIAQMEKESTVTISQLAGIRQFALQESLASSTRKRK